MGLSKEIVLTVKDYEIKLNRDIKFYENDTIDLCFSILEYGIEVKDGVAVNKLMPINALKAYMLIETPQGVDYAESTKVENNRVVFNLGNKYSQFIGIGKMQIVIKDNDGCRITLPEFPFEIRQSINSNWDKDIAVLSTEGNEIIIDEFGRKIELKKISEMEEANILPIDSYSMILDNNVNKKIKTNLITQKIENDLQSINEQLETSMKEVKNVTNTKRIIANKPYVIFVDDDCKSEFLTTWKPVADEKGIKINLACITSKIGESGYLNETQLKELNRDGYDICSHSNTHPGLTAISSENWKNECEISKNIISTLGFNDRVLVYPYGFSGVSDIQRLMIKNITKEYFDFGVDAGGGLNFMPTDNMQISRVPLSDFTTARREIDKLEGTNNLLVFISHSYNSFDVSVTKQIIDYIKTKNIDIVTFKDIQDNIKNLISIGETKNKFFLNMLGELNADLKLGLKIETNMKLSMSNPITDFDRFKITVSTLFGVNDTLLKQGGTYIVNRGYNNFGFSIFMPYNSNDIYKRIWNESGSWGEWAKLTNTSYQPTSYDMDTLIDKYTKFSWTDIEIRTNLDTFKNIGGLMRVYRGNVNFSFALYYPYNTNEVYKRRYIDSSSSWGSWEKISVI